MKELIMIRQTILLACLSAGVAFSQGLTATSPLVGLPAATFGGAGIPNTAVAVQTVNNNGNTITLGLNASERFANPVVTNNNAGTFFASVGPRRAAEPGALELQFLHQRDDGRWR
ncbi:MAG: hypothetical protein K2X03_24925 [Bryobacteraceae bacterium]|nr:hypothetical protein [Bryobacteraceae bacterium]